MHIQLESHESHAITSYCETQLSCDNAVYTENTLISNQAIFSPWDCKPLYAPNDENMNVFLQSAPEIIIIGHPQIAVTSFIPLQSWLSKKRIGFECMSIGAACRTFNVLLSEGRRVAVAILFHPH